jgi:hypothetical protein
MIHLARVEVGTTIDQELRDFRGTRAVKRRLAVAAARARLVCSLL